MVLTSVLLLALLPGCYLSHAAAGQLRLLRASRPLEAVVGDPGTPAMVRERLLLVREVRAFARQLGLAADGQYTSYAEWPGDRIVTTVVATRPGKLEPAPFHFPIVGAVPYKGFFDAARAEAEAAALRDRGFDTCLVPVPAYSTLGWFDDPVTGPMLRRPVGVLVETLLHELVHATVFAAGAARFNEGLATFVGRRAALAFWSERAGADSPEVARERERIARTEAVTDVLLELRAAVAALYAAGAPLAGEREQLEAAARARLEARRGTRAPELALNDACLAITGTYHADLPRWRRAFARHGGDLRALLDAAADAADAPDPLVMLPGAEPPGTLSPAETAAAAP